MPTYQYVCTTCDTPLEAVQSFSDAALTECPACTGRLRKVYGAVGVVFKGSGFYKNDSRDAAKKKAEAPAAKSEGSSGSPNGSSESGSSGGSSGSSDSGRSSGSSNGSSDSGGSSTAPTTTSSTPTKTAGTPAGKSA